MNQRFPSRQAAFIFITAEGGDTTTLSRQRRLSNLRTFARAAGVNLKNLFPWPFYTTCRRQAVPTCGVSRAPVCPMGEPSEPSYNMFGRGRLEDLSLLDLSPLQHEHAFGIMVIGAIEDIPLNPV